MREQRVAGSKFLATKELLCVAEALRVGSADVACDRGGAGGRLSSVPCPSESSVAAKVATAIENLGGEGLKLEEIAVISLRGLSFQATGTAGGDRHGCAAGGGCGGVGMRWTQVRLCSTADTTGSSTTHPGLCGNRLSL